MSRGLEDPAEREVEELLKAAQDDLLLKISVNRTSASSYSLFSDDSSSSLDPDLARRFHALKSGKNGADKGAEGRRTKTEEDGVDKVIGDELAARFAALKGCESSGIAVYRESASDDESDDDEGGKGSEKEVEKVMQWAMDAVRLDLISNAKGIEEDNGNLSEELEEDGESDLEELVNEENQRKKKKKNNNNNDNNNKKKPDSKKPPNKKWFIF